jgi:hypothetical protein
MVMNGDVDKIAMDGNGRQMVTDNNYVGWQW